MGTGKSPAKRQYLIAAAVLLFASAAQAKVLGIFDNKIEQLTGGIYATELDKLEIKVNDKKIEVKKFKSENRTREILESYYYEAKSNCYSMISNEFLLFSAKTLFGAASCGEKFENFGYLFFIGGNDTGYFIIAGACGGTTELIRARINNLTSAAKFSGYEDGIRQIEGAEKILSIEIILDGKTVNFGNFYRVSGVSRDELRNYYEDMLKKNGGKILKKSSTRDSDIFMARKGSKEIMLTISEDDTGKKMIFLMG